MARFGPPSKRAIADAVEAVERRFGELWRPDVATNCCIEASGRFSQALGRGTRVMAQGPRDVTGPSDAPGHVAVLIGSRVYDVTARQFWLGTEYPLIEPLTVWADRFTPDADRVLVETYDGFPTKALVRA